MWSEQKRGGCSSVLPRKSNLRFVPKTKWELPRQKPKLYWKDVLEDLDTKRLKVNQPLLSLYPPSLGIPLESSVSIRDRVLPTKPDTVDGKTILIMNEPIVKISPPSPSHNGNEGLVASQKSTITDSLEYLKSHDVGNFDLDLPQERSRPDDEKSEVIEKDRSKPEVKAPLALSAIGQISQLTKISRYVNDFLASTRVKMKSSVSSKNYVHPRLGVRPVILKEGHCIIAGTPTNADNRERQEVSPAIPEPTEEPEITNEQGTQEKHVIFEEPAEGNAEPPDNSYGRVPRGRAPSLGVASLVPSFGRMISSLEYSDSVGSRSSIESPPDDLTIEGVSPPRSPSLRQIPETKSRVFLEPPAVQYPSKSVYPDGREFWDSRSRFFGQSLPKKPREIRGYPHWPRKTIVHTIRALKTMKAGIKTNEDFYQKKMTFGSAVLRQGQSIIEKSSSSSIEQETFDRSPDLISSIVGKSSGASENSESSSNQNTEQTILGTLRAGIISEQPKLVPLIQKPPLKLEDLPPMGGMYQRKKKNKCLACMTKTTVDLEPVFRPHTQTEEISPYKSVFADFEKLLATKFTERISKARTKSEFMTDDEISPIPQDQKASSKSNELDNIMGRRSIRTSPSEKKFTPSSVRDDLITAKSFVSTLSLTSDQSRTISEQEDSDHSGLEPVAEAGEELPGAGSKFRAPCHAPLNLRPSLEPLLAMKGKKSKSIQSRSASLEKSMDEGSGEGSDGDDDDDTEEPAPRIIEQAIKSVSSLQAGDNQIPTATAFEKNQITPSEQIKSKKLLSELEYPPQKLSLKDDSAISTKSGEVSLSEEIYHQLNVQITSTDYNPSDSFHPFSPVMSDSEIIEIVQTSLDEDKPIKDILFSLLEEYSRRLSMKTSNDALAGEQNSQKITKMTNRLLALLVDSKLYLHPELTSSNLQFSSKQKPYCNSQQLRRFLPFKSYNLVAPILGMPEWHPKRWSAIKSARSFKAGFKKRVTTLVESTSSVSAISTKAESDGDIDLIVHPPSRKASLDQEYHRQNKSNPYAAFLSKPRRKVVIWRPLVERDLEGYDPESTLKNRAARVTDKICKDFCDWLSSLGGAHDTIDENILKDMFETDFTAEACRTMRVCVTEMPMVPTVVATMRHCPESGEPEVTRRQLIRDVRAERKPPKIVGFGTAVPRHLRYLPPDNNAHQKWIHCANVPQDLESMSFVWKDITHLDSVRGFSNWLSKQSQVKLPVALYRIKKKK